MASALAGCGSSAQDDQVRVAIIGDDARLSAQSTYLSAAGQHLRMATSVGLVSFDPAGRIVPGLAERWIVTDDGLRYIFRIRDAQWANGEPVTAPQIRQSLLETIGRYDDTSLGRDLAKVADVRAMTGRVIEIELKSPLPDFLSLLAQPEMGIRHGGHSIGPMEVVKRESDRKVILAVRDEGEDRDEDTPHRRIAVALVPAKEAVQGFFADRFDLVINGSIVDLPLASGGPLSRGNLRLDPTRGLLGFLVRPGNPLVANAQLREAISMAIDRASLIEAFNIDGWKPTSWPVPRRLLGEAAPAQEQWANLTIEQRRAAAARRVSNWKTLSGGEAKLRVYIPIGPGSDRLFDKIKADLERIGVRAARAKNVAASDLQWIDRVERYDSARWYLGQFACTLKRGFCSPEADALVERSLAERDPEAERFQLARANEALASEHAYIALGAPIRWSLVRGDVAGFEQNPRGLHPLYYLAIATN